MAKGNHASVYHTSQPNRISLADTIVQQDHLNMQRQEQKRREQIIDEQRREREFQKQEKLRERLLKIPKNYDTGSGSLNELQARIIQQAVNRKGEIYESLLGGDLTDSERIKLEIENQNLDMLPENLKVATQNFTKLIGDYQKGVSEGSFFRNVDFESKVLNGFENYIGSIDDNGFPLVGFMDANGDGQIDLMPWDNLKDGIGIWEFQPKLDYDKMVSEMAKGLGTVKTKDREGYDVITTKGIPLDLAQATARSMMYSPDGELMNFAKSRLTELGYDYRNVDNNILQDIERDVTERILNSKDRENLRERDTTSEQGALNRAQRERHFREGKAKDKTEFIGDPVSPEEGTWKSFYKNIPSGVKSVPVTSNKVKFNAIQTKNKTYQNFTVDNYTYDKNGQLLISGTSRDKENNPNDWMSSGSSTVNERVRFEANKEIESRLAKMIGVSVEELRQRANYNNASMLNDLPELDQLPDL